MSYRRNLVLIYRLTHTVFRYFAALCYIAAVVAEGADLGPAAASIPIALR